MKLIAIAYTVLVTTTVAIFLTIVIPLYALLHPNNAILTYSTTILVCTTCLSVGLYNKAISYRDN